MCMCGGLEIFVTLPDVGSCASLEGANFVKFTREVVVFCIHIVDSSLLRLYADEFG